eukprot:CAMPEP_0196805448 /NCGR_PEP_ID=MMETSP1362-20130617/5211_1 /TAXON_ID=163516 /ORGANISM="Leptocylindrus danicus, Strain CCMP1856" /LENGTH=114 /DNA_ID=CAMNT_0042178365 /DNA_START=309 /DNA_END=653 /DNA_ORIENTATION=+
MTLTGGRQKFSEGQCSCHSDTNDSVSIIIDIRGLGSDADHVQIKIDNLNNNVHLTSLPMHLADKVRAIPKVMYTTGWDGDGVGFTSSNLNNMGNNRISWEDNASNPKGYVHNDP